MRIWTPSGSGNGKKAPLQRSCTLDELGATATYLASDGAASMTGQVLYVDGGYEIVGM
mgnify:CR=1 FL=1